LIDDKIDVDYITGRYGSVEVKCNYVDAQYARQGKYFWVELFVGEKDGRWRFCKADHTSQGDNRIDRVKDRRYGGHIIVVNMRVYFEDLTSAGISFVNICKRKKCNASC